MLCVNPRKLPNKAATGLHDAFIQVSCGKCYACLSNRRRSWLFRLQQEELNSVGTYFCTFTYDPEYYDGFVHKSDLQKFFKKLRHYEDFTYYAIGEYGTHTFRGHAHAVIFFKSLPINCTTDDLHELLCSLWSKGFISVSRATYRRLNYVLHYHTRPKEPAPGLKTFQMFSKGLGIDFIDDKLIDYLVSTKKTTINDFNGNTYVIPRYYRKKLLEQGFKVDAPQKVFDSDNWKKRISRTFKTDKMFEISEFRKANYMSEVVQADKKKLKKFNNQDKYI